MSSHLHISIPQPCAMRWEEMSHVTDAQRYCSSCNKVIIDFTKMTDAELIAHFNRNAVSCGKFAPHQLNRIIAPPKKVNRSWWPALFVPALLSFANANAQQTKTSPPVSQIADTSQPEIQIPLDDVFRTLHDTLLVSGLVLEVDDSLREYPFVGAILFFHLEDSVQRACAVDHNGFFEIKLPHLKPGDTVKVEVRCPGFAPYFTDMVLEVQKRVILQLYPSAMQIVAGPGTVGDIVVSHPAAGRGPVGRFFWRLFHPRHWFYRYR